MRHQWLVWSVAMSITGAIGGALAAKLWLAVQILGNGRLDQVQSLESNIVGNSVRCAIAGIVVGNILVFLGCLVTKAEK